MLNAGITGYRWRPVCSNMHQADASNGAKALGLPMEERHLDFQMQF